MANDDDNTNDNEMPGGMPGGMGFAIPIGHMLERAVREHAESHDRHHMQVESIELRINNFLDGLDVEGLLVLRRILNADRDSASNNYFDGMCVTLLRVVHKVDTEGKTEAEILAAEAERKE